MEEGGGGAGEGIYDQFFRAIRSARVIGNTRFCVLGLRARNVFKGTRSVGISRTPRWNVWNEGHE